MMLTATERAEFDVFERQRKRNAERASLRKSVHDLSRLLANALTVWELERAGHSDCDEECLECQFVKRCEAEIEKAAEVLND